MSIAVATSTVDTSWQEIDVVEFEAGSLADIGDLVEEVEANLGRGNLGTNSSPSLSQVQRWLVLAKQRLAAIKNFEESKRYAYASTTQGDYIYSLPPDYRGGHVTLRDVTSNQLPRKLTVLDSARFDKQYPNPSYSGTGNIRPDIATIKGRRLIFRRPADGVYTLEIQYNRSGEDITPTDFSWLPELYRMACVEDATYRSMRMLKDGLAETYFRDWMLARDDIKKVDGKQKWAATNFQCKPWI